MIVMGGVPLKALLTYSVRDLSGTKHAQQGRRPQDEYTTGETGRRQKVERTGSVVLAPPGQTFPGRECKFL